MTNEKPQADKANKIEQANSNLKAENKALNKQLSDMTERFAQLSDRLNKLETAKIVEAQEAEEAEAAAKHKLIPVRSTNPYKGNWVIRWADKLNAPVPTKLSGGYTEVKVAKRAIEAYLKEENQKASGESIPAAHTASFQEAI